MPVELLKYRPFAAVGGKGLRAGLSELSLRLRVCLLCRSSEFVDEEFTPKKLSRVCYKNASPVAATIIAAST